MIRTPDIIPQVLGRIKPDQFADRWCRTIVQMFAQEQQQAGSKINISQMLDNVADPDLALELRSVAMMEYQLDEDEIKQLVDDCIDVIERRPLSESIEQVNEQIRDAEAEGNEGKLFELLAKKRDIAATMTK